ncbi:hypothetical protein AABB24_009574, partial [Solanum stoloniferum]
ANSNIFIQLTNQKLRTEWGNPQNHHLIHHHQSTKECVRENGENGLLKLDYPKVEKGFGWVLIIHPRMLPGHSALAQFCLRRDPAKFMSFPDNPPQIIIKTSMTAVEIQVAAAHFVNLERIHNSDLWSLHHPLLNCYM